MWTTVSSIITLLAYGSMLYKNVCEIDALKAQRAKDLDEITRNPDSTKINQLLQYCAPVVVMVEMDWQLFKYMVDEIGDNEYYIFTRSTRTLYCINESTASSSAFQSIRDMGIQILEITDN